MKQLQFSLFRASQPPKLSWDKVQPPPSRHMGGVSPLLPTLPHFCFNYKGRPCKNQPFFCESFRRRTVFDRVETRLRAYLLWEPQRFSARARERHVDGRFAGVQTAKRKKGGHLKRCPPQPVEKDKKRLPARTCAGRANTSTVQKAILCAKCAKLPFCAPERRTEGNRKPAAQHKASGVPQRLAAKPPGTLL